MDISFKATDISSNILTNNTTQFPDNHPEIKLGKIGILLVNLGTPDATNFWPMWRYLREFLSDRRVIEWPKAIWYPILYGIVLNTRPRKSGAAYDQIWNRERDESPLRTFTRSQSEKLAIRIAEQNNIILVDWAMRYGTPSICEKILLMQDKGCERILIFPLYPQYSATTTATVNDTVFRTLMSMRWQPSVRIVPAFHDEPIYIDAIAQTIQNTLDQLDFEPEKLIMSYHGIPQSYFRKGDPYHCHCMKTSRLIEDSLGWNKGRLMTTFQSRFGPEEWLQPYTDKTVEQLAKSGIKRLAIINPGFISDCLETLEEIGGEARDIFREHGGEHFAHIPCLNDSKLAIDMIEAIVHRELLGWI